MDINLLERIAKLGQMGDIVRVRPGYARNYLLPQKKAVRATEENRRQFDQRRAQLVADNLDRRSEAEDVARRLVGFSVVLLRQAGEAGQLYGSVSARDVADAVTAGGVTINRQQVELMQPIKNLGLHTVAITLHPEVVVDIIVNVARSADEAEAQERSGRAVSGRAEDEEVVATDAVEQAMVEADVSDEPAPDEEDETR
jgi:large subunit ribosomal protein L9